MASEEGKIASLLPQLISGKRRFCRKTMEKELGQTRISSPCRHGRTRPRPEEETESADLCFCLAERKFYADEDGFTVMAQ